MTFLLQCLFNVFIYSPPEDVEKYNDVNGPPSFTESISLPSETNGSNSENDEKSVSDDDVTGYSVSQSKKDSKKVYLLMV